MNQVRITDDKLGLRRTWRVRICIALFVQCSLFAASSPLHAQLNDTIHIATVRPDVAAPGMNVVVEILTLATDSLRPFGFDGLASLYSIDLVHPKDSERVVFGPAEVSWKGRLLQLPIFVLPSASLGPVPFVVHSIIAGRFSDTIQFSIATPQHLGLLLGNVTIGNGVGQLSNTNTLLVDSFIASNATIHFTLQNPDTFPSNPRFLPVVILSKGPVRLTNTTVAVDANGLDGGPGGGGGGHGFPGSGGSGFTGGGSCPSDSLGNDGSDSLATLDSGGRAATRVAGGASNSADYGGGGGTGAPYGLSGAAGNAGISRPGGYGGGSGGGEQQQVPLLLEFGGGGGGFGTLGGGGAEPFGTGDNGGRPNDGRFLIPLAGGSGGGAGKANSLPDTDTRGGSGGGGGGSLEITAFDSIVCNGAVFSARGDSGTSGFKIAAGGGGGSGGAIYLASPAGIRTQLTTIHVEGGFPGQGAQDGFSGGRGGLGRIRIDGPSNLEPNTQTDSVWTEGISVSPVAKATAAGFVRVNGFAPDTINTIDSIRIYYWTLHSAVQVVDTVRAADGSWSKWLPLPHDSLLFVAAMVEVFNPASLAASDDYEPPWLVSNASIGVIRHPASPFLVSVDTLSFGAVRVGRCKTLLLRVANKGEEPLALNAGKILGSSQFSISPDTSVTIPAYSADTFQVKYCPDSTGPIVARLSFISNDSSNSPELVTLIGNGLAIHDSLVLVPDSVQFARVLLDSCATSTVTLKSAGHDTLFLAQSTWSHAPFTLRLVPPDTVMDSGATRKLLVTFCPTDTGTFRYVPVLDGRDDTLPILGRGVLRLASSADSLSFGTICLGNSGTIFDTIRNRGNDTISVLSLEGRHISRIMIDHLLQPDSSLIIPISIPADTLGTFTDTLSIQLAGSMLSTVISYTVAGVSISFNLPSVAFDFVCIGDSASRSIRLTSTGPDTLVLSNFTIGPNQSFTILDSTHFLRPGATDSLVLEFRPQPQDTVKQTDTVHLTVRDNGCDSELVIPVSGNGLDSGLAAEPVSFDSVLSGDCKNDSIVIGNPCGPMAILDSVLFVNTDFRIVSSFPDTIYSPEGARVIVQFCPSSAGKETSTATLVFRSGIRITDTLSGVGVVLANPWAQFTVTSTTVPLNSQAVTFIRLDSSSLTGEHAINAVVTFDPSVLSPAGSFPLLATRVGMDSVTFSDVLDFSKPDTIESLMWNTLAGPRNISPVNLSVKADTFVNTRVQNGSVTITDCHGLAGQFASGGSYTLGAITPDPASEAARVTMQLGSDGLVEVAIYDMTGRLVEHVLEETLKQGSYQLIIPTTALTSGRYMLQINSMGWRATAPFAVDR